MQHTIFEASGVGLGLAIFVLSDARVEVNWRCSPWRRRRSICTDIYMLSTASEILNTAYASACLHIGISARFLRSNFAYSDDKSIIFDT